MRALLCLLPVVLAGCVSDDSFSVSQREILRQSQAEIAAREPWAANAAVFVVDSDEFIPITWRVKAGSLDRSDYPVHKGIYFHPGTERELRFTRAGCLVSYIDRGHPCLTQDTAVTTETVTVAEK